LRVYSGEESGSSCERRRSLFKRMRCARYLSIHSRCLTFDLQNSPETNVIYLCDISNVERTDLKPYCLLLETKDKRFFLSLKSDEELYGWQDDIYSRSPLMSVSNPTNFVHNIHIGFDPVSGAFTVRPHFVFHSFAHAIDHPPTFRASLINGRGSSRSPQSPARNMPSIRRRCSRRSNSTPTSSAVGTRPGRTLVLSYRTTCAPRDRALTQVVLRACRLQCIPQPLQADTPSWAGLPDPVTGLGGAGLSFVSYISKM
jgi:hypothetical protein